MSIEISYANALSYSKCKSYDAKLMSQGFVWHQIVVQHNSRSLSMEDKNELLKALYEAVEGEEFYPVVYRVRSHHISQRLTIFLQIFAFC